MIVIPAIDLMGGRVVRLREGRREEASVYSDHPEEVAAGFAAAGARRLHVVDLDGAFAGGRRQEAVIRRIIEAAPGVTVQVGGGLRDEAGVAAVLDGGAQMAVLGTAAVRAPALVERLCVAHPGRIVVAVDAREGRVAVEGWAATTDVDAAVLAARAAGWGAAAILYTDVARDGTKGGPAVEATLRLQAATGEVPVIASGGVASLADLRALAAAGARACIVGRALYDGAFTLAEALAAC